MKALKILLFLPAILLLSFISNAQSGNEFVSRRALLFADSITAAVYAANWDACVSLSYPGVVKYYGGIQRFHHHLLRTRNAESIHEEVPTTELVQLSANKKEWQCVVRKSAAAVVDGKKAMVLSYMIGQSQDEGRSWKYFDVAINSADNRIIMPDLFDHLSVPQREVWYEENLARTP